MDQNKAPDMIGILEIIFSLVLLKYRFGHWNFSGAFASCGFSGFWWL